jgi:hypothetical protein
MSDESEVNPRLSTFSQIPTCILLNDEIGQGPKLLFAHISSLTQEYGYCFGSDEYFSKQHHVDIRTIKRWIKSLKDLQTIKIETSTYNDEKGRIKSKRKIWISLDFQKMFTKGQKCPLGVPADRRDKNVPHNKISISNNINSSVLKDKKDIIFNRKINSFENIDETILQSWKERYKHIDIEYELKKCVEWILEHPIKTKKRKLGRKFLEETWFPRSEENKVYKSKPKTDPSIYEKLNPIYAKYKNWYEQLRDPVLINKGFIVLEKDCFYENNSPNFKYKLDEQKFIELLKNKFNVPNRIFEKI